MSKFAIGDRVKCVKKGELGYEDVDVGQTGTIVVIGGDEYCEIGVRWDEKRAEFHTCRGECEIGYGYFVTDNMIAKIDDTATEFKVGDVVLIKNRIGGKKAENVLAIVRLINDDTIGIEALNKSIHGHNIRGKTKIYKNNGWYINEPSKKDIEIIKGDNAECNGYKVGDRVISVSGVGINNVVGAIGTVLHPHGLISVLFDSEYKINGHDFDDKYFSCDREDGWNCRIDDVKLLSTADKPKNKPKESKPTEAEPETEKESEFGAFIGFIKEVPEQYIYVARDKDGKLFAYIDEPKIDVGGIQYWAKRFKRLKDDLFPRLTFKDGALKIREGKGDE